MRQQTLAAQTGFEKYGRKSKRERFLDEMEQVVPWAELQALVEPHYPKGENGRPPVGLSIMLRVYFVQQWFNLSDPGAEEALYESPALRQFAGVDLGRAPAPDESTILQFRHLLEKHDLGGATLNAVNQYLESRGGAHHHGYNRRCDHYSCAFVDQEPERRARSGDALNAQGEAVVLRTEGAHRSGLERRPCAFAVHVGGVGSGQAHAAGLAAWRGAQGVGRRWVSGTRSTDPAGGPARAGYDQPQSAVQELCGPVTEGEESSEGQSTRAGGTSVPDPEAHL
jgi:hypothetical protein